MPDRLNFIDKIIMTLINNFASKRCKYRILDLLLNSKEKTVLDFLKDGYLVDIGWFNAFEKKEPVGANNEPIPWITYPAIDFLSQRLNQVFDVFEFGIGNSTLFYAPKINTLTAVEHDIRWYEKVKSKLPPNVNLMHKELQYDGEYCRAVLSDTKKYNILIVDGRDRVNCIKHSLSALTPDGVIILDDSQRQNYMPAREFLVQNNFKFIDFWGISPGYFNRMCTTIFYRELNCLGL